MNALLSICLSVMPAGGCAVERPTENAPPWATEEWQEFAAHIVASEASGVPAANIVVACTLVRDVERGWPQFALRKRWFGYGEPDAADREAVEQAVAGHCTGVPNYRFVGNAADAAYWASVGMIGEGPHDMYLGPSGAAVVGIKWPEARTGRQLRRNEPR